MNEQTRKEQTGEVMRENYKQRLNYTHENADVCIFSLEHPE